MAEAFGAEVICRPKEISGDTASSELALEHMLDQLRDAEEHKPRLSILVCTETRPRRTEGGIRIKPWRQFLEELWSGDIIN